MPTRQRRMLQAGLPYRDAGIGGTGPLRLVTDELRAALPSPSPLLPMATHVRLTPAEGGQWIVTQYAGQIPLGWIRCDHTQASLIARYGAAEGV